MKRIMHTLIGMAIAGVILAPATWAVDGTSGTTGPAYLDAETNQLFDSQDPPHYVVYGDQTVTLTGHGTVTLTGGGTSTETNTYVLVLPKATVTLADTSTLTQTHFCATSPESGGIPCAGTGSKIDIGWLPTGTATGSVVTGADPRLTDARASTNTLYGDGVAFRTGTGTASGTVTSAAVATNPTVVNTSTAVATQTLSAPGGTKTWSTTLTITQTDLATTAMGAGIIPMTRTNSKVSSGVIPWGEAFDILPNLDATYDLGSSGASKRWRHGYFSGTVTAGAFSGPGLFSDWQMAIDPASNVNVTSSSWTDIGTGYSYLYWPASKIIVTGTLTIEMHNATGGSCFARIVLDTTQIGVAVSATPSSVPTYVPVSITGAADVSAGSHAVKIQVYAGSGGPTQCRVYAGTASVTISIFSN